MNYISVLKETQCSFSADSRYAPLTQMDVYEKSALQRTVKEQFKRFCKDNEEINTLLQEIKSISNVRCAHIIFTFLLGLFIYKQSEPIKSAIDKTTERLLTNAGHPNDFPFLWFLICLFHDLGYSEENKQQNSRIRVDWVNNQKKPAAFDGVPELYSKIYRQYFLYRKIEHGKTDHGIYAGLKMFKILCNIRKKHTDNSKGGWKKELEDLYNLASWVVLAHNVWFAKDVELEKCSKYEKYNLKKLILPTTKKGDVRKNAYPIRLSNYPVLFLFCLVDLIEPMKRIEKIGCCDEIDFEISDNKVKISSDLDCACVKNYLNEISKAEDWFTTTDFSNKKCVELSLIPKKPRRGSIPVKKNNKH